MGLAGRSSLNVPSAGPLTRLFTRYDTMSQPGAPPQARDKVPPTSILRSVRNAGFCFTASPISFADCACRKKTARNGGPEHSRLNAPQVLPLSTACSP